MNKLKEYLESNSDDELINRIRFDFDDIIPFGGWLPAHLSIGSESVEIPLNTYDLEGAGIEIDSNIVLRKFALKQFKQFANQNIKTKNRNISLIVFTPKNLLLSPRSNCYIC